MEYENMRVTELKALARDRGLRNYFRMRKAELVSLLQNNSPPAPTPRSRSPPPPPRSGAPLGEPPQMSLSGAPPNNATWEPIDDRRRVSLLNKKWIYSNNKK